MRSIFHKATSILGTLALTISTLSLTVFIAPSADAQIRGLIVDFAAAEPISYNHLTGGGQWNLEGANTDIARSLAGDNFNCGDIVAYLSRYTNDDASATVTFGWYGRTPGSGRTNLKHGLVLVTQLGRQSVASYQFPLNC